MKILSKIDELQNFDRTLRLAEQIYRSDTYSDYVCSLLFSKTREGGNQHSNDEIFVEIR